jgi:hypothetical protein
MKFADSGAPFWPNEAITDRPINPAVWPPPAPNGERGSPKGSVQCGGAPWSNPLRYRSDLRNLHP